MQLTYHCGASPAIPAALGAITTLIPVKEMTPTEAFADNIRRLMARDSLSQAELGRKSGVAQTLLSGLLSKSLKPKNPKFETLAKLATHFKVAPWMLLVPRIPLELLSGDAISRLVADYNQASEFGRGVIMRAAQLEARDRQDALQLTHEKRG